MTVPYFLPSRSLHGLAFALVLLLVVGAAQTGMAQTPTLDEDEPIKTLTDAIHTAESDSQLVALATALLDAREETEISFSTFKQGVRTFRKLRPAFYGNFFGDPSTATYDARYMKMDRLRRLAGYEVDPLRGLPGLFACNPMSYDPAFGGTCRGFRFASTDFFFLPSGTTSFPAPSAQFTLGSALHASGLEKPFFRSGFLTERDAKRFDTARPPVSLRAAAPESLHPDREQSSSGEGDSSTEAQIVEPAAPSVPVSGIPVEAAEKGDGSTEERLAERGIIRSDGAADRAEVWAPDEVTARMQQEAASLKRKATEIRIEQHLKEKRGGELSPQQRAQLNSGFAEAVRALKQSSSASPQMRDPFEKNPHNFSRSNRATLPDHSHFDDRSDVDRSSRNDSGVERRPDVESHEGGASNVGTSGRQVVDPDASRETDEN